METRRLLLSATALLSSLAASQGVHAAGLPPVSTSITAVTVYTNEAHVVRHGGIDLPAGESMVVVAGLPPRMVQDSITVAGSSSGGVSIGSVDTRPLAAAVPTSTEADQKREALKAQLQAIEDRLADVDVRIASFKAKDSMIARMASSASSAPLLPQGSAPAPADGGKAAPEGSAGWKSAWDAVQTGTLEAEGAIQAARVERRSIEAEEASVKRAMASLDYVAPRAASFEVAVAVHADAPAHLDLDVGYNVGNVSWRPVYDAYLDTGAQSLALREEAVVVQNTGEDWQDVALTLSTTRTVAEVSPPRLPDVILGLVPEPSQARLQSVAKPGIVSGYGGSVAMPTSMIPANRLPTALLSDNMEQAPERPVPRVLPSVDAQGLSLTYGIAGMSTVLSDAAERHVRISDKVFRATLSAKAVPRLSEHAYLQARWTQGADEAVLPGEVSLHLDGAFIGRTPMPLFHPGETAELPFGADDRIKVTYTSSGIKHEESGNMVTGHTAIQSSDSTVKVHSYHTAPIQVSVQDQVPVSRDAGLSVDMTADPQPTSRGAPDDRTGTVSWTYDYNPGEERTIHLGWKVSAPAGRSIIGALP